MNELTVFSQEDLEEEFLKFFGSAMEHYAPMILHEFMLNLRFRATKDGQPQERVYIALDNLPSSEDLFWYMERSYELSEKIRSEYLAFDEEQGMLALKERIRKWEEEHENEVISECETTIEVSEGGRP